MTAPLCLAGAVVLQALTTALFDVSFGVVDTLLMLLVGGLTFALLGRGLLRRNPALAPGPDVSAAARAGMVRLNGWTALCFFAFFLGIVIHDASVVFTLEVCVAPLVTSIYKYRRGRRSSDAAPPSSREWACTASLATLGAAMAVAAHAADPSRLADLALGAALGAVAGISAGAIAITSRALGLAGLSVQYVAGNRFHLTCAAAAVALVVAILRGQGPSTLGSVVLVAGCAVVAMVLPIFLLQYAMQNLTPLTVTAALAALPATTLLIQLVLGHLVGWLPALLALAVVPLSVVLVRSQLRPAALRATATTTSSGGSL